MFKNLNIKSLRIFNFMGIKGEIYLKFDNKVNEFIGDNGSGKSTILNAISFVFCGTDAFGNKIDFTPSDLLGSESFTSVECVYTEDLIKHEIKRIVKTNDKGKQEKSFYEDSKKVLPTAWNKFCDKDIFLSLINPLYFSNLNISDKRSFLLKLLKVKDYDLMNIIKTLESNISINYFEYLIEFKDLINDYIKDENRKPDELKTDFILEHFYNEYKNELSKINEELKVKTKTISEIEKQKPILDVEDIFEYNSVVYKNEEIAFISLLENYTKSKTDSDLILLTEFLDFKQKRYDSKNAYKQYKKDFDYAEELRTNVCSLEDKKTTYKNMMCVMEKCNDEIINLFNNLLNIEFQFINKYNKEEFNILYNNVNFESCSLSEKITTSLLLIDNLSTFLNVNLPIFIDNIESISSLPKIKKAHQLFSFQIAKDYKLSQYLKDSIVEVYTSKPLPIVDKKKLIPTRIIGSDFNMSE